MIRDNDDEIHAISNQQITLLYILLSEEKPPAGQ